MKKASAKGKKTAKSSKRSKVKAVRKNPVKKTAAAKRASPPRAAAPAIPAKKKALLDQLMKVSGELDEKGVAFLVQQARVLEHNLQVERLGRERKETQAGGLLQPGVRTNKTSMEVKEADDGSSFVIVINNARNFFARDEMRRLVSICHASSDAADAGRRLYNWLALHRKDVLIDTDIGGATDQALATIYTYLISHYAVKDQ
jgi:hypothetical protein